MRPKDKKTGRPKGTTNKAGSKDWAGMALLSAFGWTNYDIGKLWGVSAKRAGQCIRAWRNDCR